MKKSEMMKRAHALAREMEGHYHARLALALREVWKLYKLTHGNPAALHDITQIALKRVLAGKARRKSDGYSQLDSLNSTAFLWQNAYKYDYDGDMSDGALISKLNGDVYNECYCVAADVTRRKTFDYFGQAVWYLSIRFAGMITSGHNRFDLKKTTHALKIESALCDTDWAQLYDSAPSLDEHVIRLDDDHRLLKKLQAKLTAQQLDVVRHLARGRTYRDIAADKIASPVTIRRTKAKLYSILTGVE